MISGNFLIAILIVYYIRIFYGLFKKKTREKKISINKKLEDIRKIPIKTIEQQKEFIDMKYPKVDYKFSWRLVLNILINIVVMIGLYMIVYRIFYYTGFNIGFWWAVGVLFIVPVLMNMILRRFNLHNDDFTIFMRR